MNHEAKTSAGPGQFAGIAIIAVAVVVVSFCLLQQSDAEINAVAKNKLEVATQNLENVAGFDRDHWFLPADGMLGFVEIAAGEFLMGSDPAVDGNAYENERWSNRLRRGRVELPAYFIGRYEVTVAQFTAFVAATGYTVDAKVWDGEPDYPVTNITWPEALAYCRWLTTQMQTRSDIPAPIREKIQQGWKIAIPNEAQWEKAARGTGGQIYPWGNQPDTRFANFRGSQIKAVGSMPCEQCRYGLADMSGNVWELTRSFYLPYPFNEDQIPDLEGDALLVMRGGSYADSENNVRAAVRGGVDPGVRNGAIGFRVVLEAP